MKPVKRLIFLFLFPLLVSCQNGEPPLSATERWQISDRFIVDGKLSAHGAFTALLLADNSLEVWNNKVRKQVSGWQTNQLVPKTMLMDLSESAEYILSANDTTVQVWYTDNEESLGNVDFSTHLGDAKITQILFLLPPYLFLVGTSSGDVIFADSLNNSYRVNRHHTSDVVQLALSKDQRTLFSGGNDGLVVKWDMINYRPIVTKRLPFRIVSLAIGRDNQIFISDALKDHILWDSSQNSVVGQITYWQRFKSFRHAIFTPHQPWLVTSSPKAGMHLWHTDDMTMRGSWQVEAQTPGSTVEDIKVIGTRSLRTLSTNGVLQDWDLSSFVLKTIK
ncbi:WD40 repeat domain-containing protein [Salinimonas marina]|uniref:WD40 repeat domain-containing protein n=1 Tax=Salinimonas marina TaxID=2785918 RepID=A0A7S9DVU5_9ALTE|nr:WD40 repeat domain-containing protein [Salinimonas marina]QPG04838.1 WD40 repeat domain-containing protein [Salinimonas marina]